MTDAPFTPRLMVEQPAGPDLARHLEIYGPVEVPANRAAAERLLSQVTDAGLRGRGGAWFPTAVKMRGVLASAEKHRHKSVVICNAMEGEPASSGDAWLMRNAPHLILDGIELATAIVGAHRAFLAAHEGAQGLDVIRQAIAARPAPRVAIEVVAAPARYVASEESALARFIGGGPALPLYGLRPYQHGVNGQPTLVNNAETLSQVALIARKGAQWFRSVGTQDAPGTGIVSVGGAVIAAQQVETPLGVPTRELLARAGGPTAPIQAFRTGGFGGTWTPAGAILDAPWDPDAMRALGLAVGSGILWAHPEGHCGLVQAARTVEYLAGESAGQCGPCAFGLSAVADDFTALGACQGGPATLDRLARRLADIPRRGGCALPDGAVRMAQSALATFALDVKSHVGGSCVESQRPLPAPDRIPWAPVPQPRPNPVIAVGKDFR